MKITTKAVITCISVLIISCNALADSWHIETADSMDDRAGSATSLTLDSNGNPHISYFDETNNDVKYTRYDGSSWEIDPVDMDCFADPNTSIALNSNDIPYISYYDYEFEVLKLAYWSGSAWDLSVIDFIGDYGISISNIHAMKIDSSDNLHIAYNINEGAVTGLFYAYKSDSVWEISVVDTEGDSDISIALDSNDYPHISYNSYSEELLKYAHWDGSSWIVEEVVSVLGGSEIVTSIAMDSNDNPHISYCDWNGWDIKYAFKSGSVWETNAVDSSVNTWYFNSIALDSSDNPHIAYCGDYDLRYAYWNGTSWELSTLDTEGVVGEYNFIVVDSNDNPSISYYDWTNGNLKYAWYGTIGIDDIEVPVVLTGFSLSSAVPNPNDGSASISFALPKTCEVNLSLYDIKGRKIATLASGSYQPGEIFTDVNGLNSGIYIYKLIAGEFSSTKKMVVK